MTSRMLEKTAAPPIHAKQRISVPAVAIAMRVETSGACAGKASSMLLPEPDKRNPGLIPIDSDEAADSLSSKADGVSVQICAMVMLFLLFCAVLMSNHALRPMSQVSKSLSILLQP